MCWAFGGERNQVPGRRCELELERWADMEDGLPGMAKGMPTVRWEEGGRKDFRNCAFNFKT